MHYELCGMVATPDVLAGVPVRHPAARLVSLEQGLALVPVTDELVASLPDEGPGPPESGFRRLTGAVLGVLTLISLAGPVAYLEADYWGRSGWQTAAVWYHGTIVLGPCLLGEREPFPETGGGPIGAALRRVGAVRVGRRDEFVASGLGRCRSTGEWR
jgi:hypothetical protein